MRFEKEEEAKTLKNIIPVYLRTAVAYMFLGASLILALATLAFGFNSPYAQTALHFAVLSMVNLMGYLSGAPLPKPWLLRWADYTMKVYFGSVFLWVAGMVYGNLVATLLAAILICLATVSNFFVGIILSTRLAYLRLFGGLLTRSSELGTTS